ncbi:MAG: pyridine nucleotide-disulfide oxidoreductase [Candidatus Magasanikbacteria bacterium]|nr:pyridine nucleotide-disulfide oxidoreductase [Candidatus Magasanikbacteria bacterium]
MFDLIIIGGAAVGCSAAVYAARRKLNFKVVTDNIGGEVALSGETNNWPGTQTIDGYELSQAFYKHAQSYGVEFDEGWIVGEIVPTKNYHVVKAKNASGEEKTYETKTVIIGTGIHPKKLGISGEMKLDRKGITSCTVCDGPLFKNKDTVTIGAGNSGLESALMMAGIAKNVYVLTKFANTPETQGGFPKGDKILIDKLKEIKNVKIIYEAKITEIVGETKVEGVKYTDANGKEQALAVQGAMVHIGMIPNSGFATILKKNKQGEIVVDKLCHTNVPGIFAAGDVTDINHKQIVIAAGQGVTAALEAIGYINLWKPT